MKKLILSLFLLLMPVAQAKEIDKPVFTYGETLTVMEKARTREILEVSGDAEEVPVFTSELNDLLHDNTEYYQVISSAYIEPSKDKGVSTKIVTPDTITEKTENQYTNAAITAGATNVNIKIASVRPVDGSGALAGLYKTYRDNGFELDSKNVEVAQEELAVISEIAKNENNTDDQLTAAIANMKKDIIDLKAGKSNYSSVDEIVIENINIYNLNVSDEDVAKIKNLMNKFSTIQLTDEQKEALTNLANKLLDNGGDFVENARNHLKGSLNEEDKAEIQSLWQRIVEFFKDLFDF